MYNIANTGYALDRNEKSNLRRWYKIHGIKQIAYSNCGVRWNRDGSKCALYSYTTRVMVAHRIYTKDGKDAFVLYYDGINTYSRTTTRHIGRFIGLLSSGVPGYQSPLSLANLELYEGVKINGTEFYKGGRECFGDFEAFTQDVIRELV